MQKACFLQGKCSSRVAPVLLPLPLTDPIVSGFPLGRLKGYHVPSPPALPGSVSLCTARSCVPSLPLLYLGHSSLCGYPWPW